MNLSYDFLEDNHKSESSKTTNLARIELIWANGGMWQRVSYTSPSMTYEQESIVDRIIRSINNNSIVNHGVADDSQKSNLCRLSDIKKEWKDDGISSELVNKACIVIMNLHYQPVIYPTRRKSIQLQFELPDTSYLEFEIFEDKITCMEVPKRKYDEVFFPQIIGDDYDAINSIVEDFYGIT